MPTDDKSLEEEIRPDKDTWQELDGFPGCKVKGDRWEMTFRCVCGVEVTFSGTNAERRGKMHLKRFHSECIEKNSLQR